MGRPHRKDSQIWSGRLHECKGKGKTDASNREGTGQGKHIARDRPSFLSRVLSSLHPHLVHLNQRYNTHLRMTHHGSSHSLVGSSSEDILIDNGVEMHVCQLGWIPNSPVIFRSITADDGSLLYEGHIQITLLVDEHKRKAFRLVFVSVGVFRPVLGPVGTSLAPCVVWNVSHIRTNTGV